MSVNLQLGLKRTMLRMMLGLQKSATKLVVDARNNQGDECYFCLLYCEKSYVKLKQHLISQHSENAEVAEMISKRAQVMQK